MVSNSKKNLAQILGIKYPFIQGGMANISDGKFAAAAANAGAMGLIAAGGLDLDGLEKNIKIAKENTDKPFGVNVMLKHPQVDDIAQLLVDMGVKFITTGAGNPAKYMEVWKEAGITVFPVVPSSALALRMQKNGADGVIAEGTESGGHVGEMTTMALVPQVVEALEIPVVAAGGIASGDQLVAAFALGACGVQIGTCLLVSKECPVHENYKQAILDANDVDTVVTGRFAGSPVRQIKNRMTRAYLKDEKTGQTREELGHYMLGALRKAVNDGDARDGSVIAGQVSGMLHEIRPISEILEDLYKEGAESLKRLEARMATIYG